MLEGIEYKEEEEENEKNNDFTCADGLLYCFNGNISH